MPKEPSYYDILGLRPEADAAAIDGAYRGRSLRFRVGQPRTRSAEPTGPTQDQIEQAYAILGDPESRALYDAVYFPAKASTKRRRRLPIWVWAIIGVWIVALLSVIIFGLRSRTQSDGGAIERIAGQTATIVAGGASSATTSATAVGVVGSGGSPTIAALPVVTVTRTASGVTATVAAVATATSPATSTAASAPSATQTTARTATSLPTNTATTQPPTATTAPPPTVAPTAIPPTVAPEPTAEPEPEPTATPSFRATDRIGTSLSVNLRNGPGAGYASLGLLPTGTLLQATGQTATVSGQLWRRFIVQDGRVGWVRDLDVLPAR